MKSAAVLGAGSWGVALANLLCSTGKDVTLWSAVPAEIESLKETHRCEPLKGFTLPESIKLSLDLEETLKDKDIIILAVPSIYIRPTARNMAPYIREGQLIVNVAKGIEESTLMILTDIIKEEIPQCTAAVLSGPSHAEEVAILLPTSVVAGADDADTAKEVQDFFMSPVFRVYTSQDMLGIEIGGALKNVIALAAGAADGLGYGDNTKAALITRGIHEISRLGVAMGGKQDTFGGLSGIGDLIVTCASVHSRNRRAGYLIGKGYSVKDAMDEVRMVVEGVYSARAGRLLAEKYNVEVPIIEEVNLVLFDGKSARDAVRDLMMRDKTTESS